MLTVMNPASGQMIKQLVTDNKDSVHERFLRCQQAQKAWREEEPEKRVAVIEAFWQLLRDNNLDCAKITSEETGRPVGQVLGEINASEGRIRFFMERFQKVMASQKVYQDPDVEELISFEPLGVIANISAWNYPYFVGFNVIIPALLTGNGVMYKPSEFSAMTGMKIAELLQQAGLPDGVFMAVIGDGAVGQALLDEDINGAFFTGSYQTGRKIHEYLAPKLIPVGLELGGKDPCYVTDDVDIASVAASVADGAFYNCGQSCCSVERIYVHEKIHDAFLEEFIKVVKGFKQGDPRDPETYLGPLTRKPQIAVLLDQVDDAVKKGAILELGGNELEGAGHYFEATVLSGVNHDMKLMREESFGPIIGIQKVSNDQQALELMNDTDYGLTSSVFCRDESRSRSIMYHLNSGTVYRNCCDRVSAFTPWSGRKNSGLGSTLGEIGIETFLQPKAWHLK